MIPPRGAITALVTPFRDGRINCRTYESDIARQLESGISGLVACGTTAETPTLEAPERTLLIRSAVVCADGKVPVFAGTGTNSTSETIIRTREARKLGADAALVVTPYYSRPSQEGLCRHFEAIAAAGELPVILYSVPGRTGVDLDVESVARLARLDGIVGLKEAGGRPHRCRALRQVVPHTFRLYSGNDATVLSDIADGADGSISVISNAFPSEWQAVCTLALSSPEAAREAFASMAGLVEALALETNPCPIKYLLSLTCPGHSNEVRLPLVPIEAATAARIRRALEGVTAIFAAARAGSAWTAKAPPTASGVGRAQDRGPVSGGQGG